DLEIPHVEAVKGRYAELGAFAPVPELRHRGADRRDNAKTGHDDTVWYRGPLHLELVLLLYAPAMHGDAGRPDQAFAAAAPELSMRARTRSTTEPTVLKSAASSLALYGISMPEVSSMSNTIIARSRDSILRSVRAVLSPISSRGSFMCFLRMSMILVATSSISSSHRA